MISVAASESGLRNETWPLQGHEIVPKKKLKELRRRSNFPGLINFSVHMGTLVVTGFLIHLALGTLWVIPAMVMHGAIIVLLFAPIHECSHNTAFRSRWLNQLVGIFAATLTMRPFIYFKYRHTAHHTYTQHRSLDPDIVPFPGSLRDYVLMILGASFWPKMVKTYWHGLTGRFSDVERSFIPECEIGPVRREIIGELLVYMLAAAVSIALQSWAILIYWLIPRIVGEPILRAIRMAEHTGAEESPDLLANTRTTLANPVFCMLYWNMPYHAEHHLISSVPFHMLPKLHDEVGARLKCVAHSYFEVHSQIIHRIMRRKSSVGHASENE